MTEKLNLISLFYCTIQPGLIKLNNAFEQILYEHIFMSIYIETVENNILANRIIPLYEPIQQIAAISLDCEQLQSI